MNIQCWDILKALLNGASPTQRLLADSAGCSLGAVNKCVRQLREEGLLTEDAVPSPAAYELAAGRSPRSAIILAAGVGMRMVPINTMRPKGLLEVNGEPLIERTIKQLHAVGISDISVVVGFMKERYEYLQDQYSVRLISNSDYAVKNNLHSLYKAVDRIDRSYIIPCDIWCRENPYSKYELYSWYMVGKWTDDESTVRMNRKRELVPAQAGEGSAMLGISYVQGEDAALLKERLAEFAGSRQYNKAFWEQALMHRGRLALAAMPAEPGSAIEINTYEQLRELDMNTSHLQAPAIAAICRTLRVEPQDISRITVLKKGMTNRSFLFDCGGRTYITRVPGEGSDRLIDRAHEAVVYGVVNGRGICDDVVYIDPDSGIKITRFIGDARTCDPLDPAEVAACMRWLRRFHEMKLEVGHDFDIFRQLDYYESLKNGIESAYRDYDRTKSQVLRLRGFIESCPRERCLTHIDAVPDNFLFFRGGEVGERICLIDWEYAAMQDPHVDIAMFGIYSMYDRARMDSLISDYFPEGCGEQTRYKIYAYVAACGLLWSNWCEYKMSLGVDFGEYSIRQYMYAKEYSQLVLRYMDGREGL